METKGAGFKEEYRMRLALLPRAAFPVTLLLMASALHAAQVGITVNVGNHNGDSLALLFQLTNANTAVNSATLSNFSFTNATFNGTPVFQGAGSGSVAGGILLGDTSNPNTARIDFTPNAAATVTFNLDISENYTGPGAGDFFGLNILLNGSPLSSNAPGGTNLFLSGPIGQNGATFTTFTDGRGISLNVGTPFPDNTAVPEPSSLAMLGLGMAALGAWRKSR
jgi:hypothetical protein